MGKKIKDNTPIVMRGKIGDITTYGRIPIINKYPLPNEDTHPIEAIKLYLKYLTLILQYPDTNIEALKISHQALDIFKTFEVVDVNEKTENINNQNINNQNL